MAIVDIIIIAIVLIAAIIGTCKGFVKSARIFRLDYSNRSRGYAFRPDGRAADG